MKWPVSITPSAHWARAGWNEALRTRGPVRMAHRRRRTAPVEQRDLPLGWDQLETLAARLGEWASGGAAA
jgi:hypothetical protein